MPLRGAVPAVPRRTDGRVRVPGEVRHVRGQPGLEARLRDGRDGLPQRVPAAEDGVQDEEGDRGQVPGALW